MAASAVFYTASVENLPDPLEEPALLEELEGERKRKTLRFLRAEDRKLSLGAGLLLGEILPLYGGDAKKVQTGLNGKPWTDGVFFNLSHSGSQVALAVGSREVGCDVERVVQAPLEIVRHYFSRPERDYLFGLPPGEGQNRGFFRLWTVKESYMKMTGEGMSLPLERLEVRLGENVDIYRDGKRVPCFLKEYEWEGYCAAVCAEEEISDVRLTARFRGEAFFQPPGGECRISIST